MAHDEREECAGCAAMRGRDAAACQAPEPVPWIPFDRCMSFFEAEPSIPGRC
jgi:hypothetical protein